ncbi:hypothetical protein X566_19110 [Afipia sp. P52-10]|uniref:PDC sensor domain-containing protein n=1 Tax=Afipia sp. P52-10 TaxID=1429916 RepID=UPI0003DF2754|nr:cache domain-containing protein [Afipia sp. P52-10]ETR75876.1 hypothetical protein X566_19110 [Afipia sp. P52-10]
MLLGVSAICCLMAIVTTVNVWSDRDRRLAAAHQHAESLARVLDEQTGAMILGTDLALLGIAESLRRPEVNREHDPNYENWLRRLLANLPGVRALFVIGPDGFIIQDSDQDTPRANLSDRDYFQAHRSTSDRGLFIGRPLVSRSVGTWFLGLSRPVNTVEGAFGGVAAAALELSYLERLYRETRLGPDDVIPLVNPEGALIARMPAADDRVGKPLMSGQSGLVQALARRLERSKPIA